jgi:hypothetical protein
MIKVGLKNLTSLSGKAWVSEADHEFVIDMEAPWVKVS